MKRILTILTLLLICFLSKAQSPVGYPTRNSAPWYQFNKYMGVDSAFINATSDTNWHPRFAGTQIYKSSDSSIYWWTGNIWIKAAGGSGGSQSWDDVMQVSPDLNSDYTSDFNGNDWSITNAGALSLSGTSINFFGGSGYNFPTTDGIAGYSLFTDGAGQLYFGAGQSPIVSGDNTYQFQDSTNTPPVSFPSGFDTTYWMVGGAGTGIFSGNNYKIAVYVNGVFDSFITPTLNDWGQTLDDNIWHQYDGATWPRRNSPPWNTNGNVGGGILGSTNNTNVFFRRNGANQIIFQNNGVRFPVLTGASAGLMGLSTLGLTSNVQIGSGLLLSGGTLSSTVSGGITTADNGLTANTATNVRLGGALVVNTTISGAFTLNLNSDRTIINAADSVLVFSATKTSLGSLDSLNGRANVNWFKSARAFWGASALNYWGVDSLGWRAQNGELYGLGLLTYGTVAAAKPLQQDTVTGRVVRKLIDVSSSTQITGVLPVANGGTGLATLTANNLMVGNGTGNVTFIAPSTSGNVLTSNGTTWVSSAPTTSPFTRGVMAGVNSLNLIYQVTQSDSAVFGVLSSGTPLAKYHHVGTAYFSGIVGIGQAPATSAGYELQVNGDVIVANGLRVNGGGSSGVTIGTFSDPSNAVAQLFVSQPAGSSGAASIVFSNGGAISTNGALYGLKGSISNNQTNATAGTGFTGLSFTMTQASGGGSLSNYWGGADVLMSLQSTNATAITTGWGYKGGTQRSSSGTQKFADYMQFWDASNLIAGTNPILYTNYYGLRLDSLNSTTYSGNYYPIFARDNLALGGQIILQPKTSHGTTTSPTAFVMLGAGTTANSQLRFIPGVAPTSPNDGDHWYEDTNDKLMFRQNATSIEVLGVSAVNNVTPTLQNRTLTVSINGTTYYITAKTTND